MAEKNKKTTSIALFALQRGHIKAEHIEECKNLQKKSKNLGIPIELTDLLVKRGYLKEEILESLKQEFTEVSELTGEGKAFGNYVDLVLIGTGGMGRVYRAVHPFTNRIVAIKILNTKLGEKENVERFLQEIRALGKLHHPNIVTVYDAGKINNRYYFTMEYLKGPSLKEILDKCQKDNDYLSVEEAKFIIIDIAKALEFAHMRGVVHRDVKPENIIMDENGNYKLTDFGVVMHTDNYHKTLTQQGMMVGSPYYCSPEQAEGNRKTDGRSDIYSLGATFYHAVAGRPLYMEGDPSDILRQHVAGKWVSPKKYNPKISNRTVSIIKKMMAKKREDRYQSMSQVIDTLEGTTFKKNLYSAIMITASVLLIFLSMEFERAFRLWSKILEMVLK